MKNPDRKGSPMLTVLGAKSALLRSTSKSIIDVDKIGLDKIDKKEFISVKRTDSKTERGK